MPLNTFFTDQFDQLQDFLVSPNEVVRCVRIDAEMKPMFNKALAKMEETADFPHVILSCTEHFEEPLSYFGGLLELITQEFEQNSEALAGHNINPAFPGGKTVITKTPKRFLRYAQAVAESLPDSVGSLVFVLDPDTVEDPVLFRKSIHFLSSRTKSKWLKFLLLDKRVDPFIQKLSDKDRRIFTQTFYLGPKEMERLAVEDLNAPDAMNSPQGRQTLGLLAGFAFARKEYDQARELQTQWVTEAEENGDPGEIATAWYNLGNTLLGSESFTAATDAYCKACTICMENELNALAPFVYTNLGVSLHRQDEFKQAFDVLRIARDMFKAQKQRPGRAHVIDTLAGMYAIDGKNKKAERTWLYALSLYEGMTSSHFADLRENGSQAIVAKLEQFYQETGQAEKIESLHNRTAS
jgi:tetratricopeptide (TPR) repeat protein